jgi:hypothetical protein
MEKTKLAIVIEGGLIQQVFSDRPVEYALIDLDTETQERTMKITNNDGVEIEIFRYANPIEETEVNPKAVGHYFQEVTKKVVMENEETN